MATFFGEILPVISRAVDDDEDDDLAPPPKQLVLQQNGDADVQDLCGETLIVTVGDVAWRFVELHYGLNKSSKVAEIKEIHSSEDDCGFEAVSKQPKIVTSLHKAIVNGKTTSFAVCKGYIPPGQIWPLTMKIFNVATNPKAVFVLTSSTVQEYKCEDIASLAPPLVRSLSTTTAIDSHPVFPTLELPNMLKNLTAAVLSYCQFHGIPGVVYTCYTENMHLDVPSVQAFSKLLETPQFNNGRDSEVVRKKIFQVVKNSNFGNGLYT